MKLSDNECHLKFSMMVALTVTACTAVLLQSVYSETLQRQTHGTHCANFEGTHTSRDAVTAHCHCLQARSHFVLQSGQTVHVDIIYFAVYL